MERKLVLKRKKELNNRGRSFDIYINENYYDSLSPDEGEKILFLNSNQVEIQFKIDWCSSSKKTIDLGSNEENIVEVSSSISNFLWYFIVGSITISILLLVALNEKLFLYLAFLIFLIPLYKITINKNDYIKFILKE